MGWQTSHRIDRQLVCDTFNYTMSRQGYPPRVMEHWDQGSQYCSRDFIKLLLTNNYVQSLLRKATCWNKEVLFDYIEIYYKRIRRHSANG